MRYRLAALTVGILTLGLAAGGAALPDLSQVDQVEEDWELVVDSPDPLNEGPQTSTTMSPAGVGTLSFATFNLNYRDQPTFISGGLQVSAWENTNLVENASAGGDLMETAGETVTWTQRLSLAGGIGKFQVVSGRSQTWGNFGDDGRLSVSFQTAAVSMVNYSPAVSLSKSGVTWQSNHVTRMTLLQVRYFAAGKLIFTDDVSRPVTLQR